MIYMHPRPDDSDVRFYPSLIPVQATSPAASAQLWVDTSTEPPTLKGWDGAAWETVASAANVHESSLLGTSDLNTVTTPGNYLQTLSADATLARNYPVVVAGHLEVMKAASSAFVMQRYTEYDTTSPNVWVRTYTTAWATWQKIGTQT